MLHKRRLGILIGGIAVLVAGGNYIYNSFTDTSPEQTIQQVEKSVVKHDKEDFYEVVNLDSVLTSSYDDIVDSLTDSDKAMTDEARESIKNFTQMLKAPLLLSLKSSIENYIDTGEFRTDDNKGLSELIGRVGIDKIEYRGLEDIKINPKDENEAVAKIKIYQNEMQRDFIIEVILQRDENDKWQVIGLKNVKDFMNRLSEVRHSDLIVYLDESAEINARHDKNIRNAEDKYNSILSRGSLNQDSTRSDLREVLIESIQKDWELRKQELFGMSVPVNAETLHNLRLRICDLEIAYADEYAQWLSDKKSSTLKSAEDKKRQSETLQSDIMSLIRRMSD